MTQRNRIEILTLVRRDQGGSEAQMQQEAFVETARAAS